MESSAEYLEWFNRVVAEKVASGCMPSSVVGISGPALRAFEASIREFVKSVTMSERLPRSEESAGLVEISPEVEEDERTHSDEPRF